MQSPTAGGDVDPDFTLVQLRYFVAAADAGTVSAAAQHLHTSQSALSSAIHRLERRLGCDLFVRHHARGITPTASGRRLLDEARALLDRAGALQELGRDLQEGLRGELHVGCFLTLAPLYVPRVVARLRARHPGLALRVHESDGAGVQRALRSGEVEAGLTYDLDLGPDVALDPVDERLPYALVPARHPAAGRARVSLRELAGTPFVMLDLPETSRFMLDMLHRAGATPAEIVRTGSVETVRALVAAGEGFAVLSRPTAPTAADGDRVRAVPIVDAVAVRVGTVRLAGVRPTRRTTAFERACREVARELDAPAG